MNNGIFRIGKFVVYFLLYSLIATVLHEYMHLMALRALGGEGSVLFGIGPLVFPWDESHVIVTKPPTDGLGPVVFASSGGLLALIILAAIYLSYGDRTIRAALELTIIPQITWTVTEPISQLSRHSSGPLSEVIDIMPSVYVYHILLFTSWLIGAIHVLGVHRRLLLNLRKR